MPTRTQPYELFVKQKNNHTCAAEIHLAAMSFVICPPDVQNGTNYCKRQKVIMPR